MGLAAGYGTPEVASAAAKRQKTAAALSPVVNVPILYGTQKSIPVRRATQNSTKNLPEEITVYKGFPMPRFMRDEESSSSSSSSTFSNNRQRQEEEEEAAAAVPMSKFFITKSSTIAMLLKDVCRHWHLPAARYELRDELDRVWPTYCSVLDEMEYRFASDPDYFLMIVPRDSRSPWMTAPVPELVAESDDHENGFDYGDDGDGNRGYDYGYDDGRDVGQGTGDLHRAIQAELERLVPTLEEEEEEEEEERIREQERAEQHERERAHERARAQERERERELEPAIREAEREKESEEVAVLSQKLAELEAEQEKYQKLLEQLQQRHDQAVGAVTPEALQGEIARWQAEKSGQLVLIRQKEAELEAARARASLETQVAEGLREAIAGLKGELEKLDGRHQAHLAELEKERTLLKRHQQREKELAESLERIARENAQNIAERSAAENHLEELGKLLAEKESRLLQLADAGERRQSGHGLALASARDELAALQDTFRLKSAELEKQRQAEAAHQQREQDLLQRLMQLAADNEEAQQRKTEAQTQVEELAEALAHREMQLAALMHSSSTSSSSYSTSSTSSSSSSQPLDLPSNAGARGPVPDSQVYCFRDGGVFAADVVPQLDVDLLRDPIIKVSGNLLLTRSGRLFDLSSNPPVERELPEPAIQTRSGAGGPGNVDRPRSAKACAGSYLMISQSGLLSSWSVEHPEKPLLVLLPDRSFSKIACGTAHCLAISRTGQVYSWGQGRHGELGHGDRVSACPSPQVVRSLQYIPALKIACGRHHSLALTRDNRAVYSWGCGDEGRLGLGEARNQWEPRHITRLEEEVARIAAGGFHSAAITTSGHLYTWGSGKFGQLGHLNQKDRLLPTVVEALSALRIVRVACDMLYSAVVSADGNIHTFGFGMAASTNSPEEYTLLQIAPVPRRLLTNKHIVKIGAGNLLIAVPGRIIGMSSSIPIDL